MRKFIYQSAVERLALLTDGDGRPVIRHFDLWNVNLTYAAENEAFNTPAVFVEFANIEWRHLGGGVREAAVEVILHVITQRTVPSSHELPYEEQFLEVFDLLTAVNKCLHGHFRTSENFGHDAMTAKSSATDHDFEELRHDIEIFTCHATDASARPAPATAAVRPTIDF